MTKEELEKRIEKKESDIAKIEKRIAKWTFGMNEEAKKIVSACELLWDNPELNNKYNIYKEYAEAHEKDATVFNQTDWNKGPQFGEAYRAYRDLAEAKLTLTKYKNAYAIQTSRDSQAKIQVIVDFLDLWEEQVISFIEDEVQRLKELYDIEHERVEKHNSGWYRNHPEEDERSDYREWYRLYSYIHPWARECYSRKSEDHLDRDHLKKILDKEKENKYWDLVNRITEKAGEIVDASELRISPKGNIDGYVTGTQNKVHVETVGAGGYNTDTIVNSKHGQIFHYRTLVHIVK